ncbi:MAG: hypothetical protein NVSMB63_19300 [Sediminibacterium sp.]
MNRPPQELTDQELVDRLADLTLLLSSERGIKPTHEVYKTEIENIQVEIEARKQAQPGPPPMET